jgi:hypothetical protein
MPEGGHTGLAKPGSIASNKEAVPAAKYSKPKRAMRPSHAGWSKPDNMRIRNSGASLPDGGMRRSLS